MKKTTQARQREAARDLTKALRHLQKVHYLLIAFETDETLRLMRHDLDALQLQLIQHVEKRCTKHLRTSMGLPCEDCDS